MRLSRTAAAVLAVVVFSLAPVRFAGAGQKMSGTSAQIARSDATAGGGRMTSALLSLSAVAGQAALMDASGATRAVASGLGELLAQPGTVTALAAVSKTTGTLTLAWTAPGLDGFQGAVVNGFYRIDYSSDPAHVFDPTSYQVQLATTVQPGDAQTLVLSGLQPNTTYFARVYLASSRLYAAETSGQDDDPTLANAPVAPVVTGVFQTSATVSWTLPGGGAEGYAADASTTAFGALFPGGVVTTSATPNGLVVSLTLQGLSPSATYYLKVASVNWKGEQNHGATLSFVMPTGFVPPVSGLAASLDPQARRVNLSWTNPSFGLSGVVVVLSTSPTETQIQTGSNYVPGQILADSAVVRSTAVATSLADSGLMLDTTYFYHVFAQGPGGPFYSTSVVASVFLDLPPQAPSGLSSFTSPDGRQFFLSWNSVTANSDGTPFVSTAAPTGLELARYEVYRSSTVSPPSWVLISTMPVGTNGLVDTVPVPGGQFLYRVASVDSLGHANDRMAVATDQSVYVFAGDGLSRLRVPAAVAGALNARTNGLGTDVAIVASTRAASGEGVITDVVFNAVKVPREQAYGDFRFPQPLSELSLHYAVVNGAVTPSGVSGIGAGQAADSLGMYWNDGAKFVKLYGTVDPAQQAVTLKTAMPGDYQVRALARAAAFAFDVSGISNRAITPNGDGLNDVAVFTFDNPKDSAFTGRIYDLTGAFVSEMSRGPLANTLQWDGRSGGRVVSGGAYVYEIRAEGKRFSGTVFVIR